MRIVRALAVGVAASLLLATAATAAPRDDRSGRTAEQVPGRYIVVFRDSVDEVGEATRRRERRDGFRSRFRYRHTIKGFSATLSRGQVRKLRRDPQVAFVSPDRRVTASATLASGDTAPTGVRRIEAAGPSGVHGASSVSTAVIDTGIDLNHPDLNAVSGTNCVSPGSPAQDDEGHGTHVAGTVAARNDGSGVVGVAPGTKLHAVKVLDSNGSGTWSQVICGIDWVTATRTDSDPANDVGVVNMSLGGGGERVRSCADTTDAMHKAICRSTGAGVVYAVAAGNDGWDFDYESIPDVPAAYPQVVTVTAASDTDGKPGALGSDCGMGWSAERDDRYASFSNYALKTESHAHTLAAPGVCITSDKLGGGTTQMSGTSMASPHVAGTLALCLGEGADAGPCSGLSADQPSQFIEKVTKTDETYGFYGDPSQPLSGGQYFGYLGWVAPASSSTEPSPDTTAPAAPSGLTATAGDARADLDWADNAETDLAGYNVYRSTSAGTGYTKVASSIAPSQFADTAVSNGTTYYYVATAVDTTGNESASSQEVSVTPQASTSTDPGTVEFSLSASPFKVKGVQHADLTWNKAAASTASVDVYRDGKKMTTTANDGAHTDNIGKKGGGSYTYKLCEAGSTTACSNEVTVTF